MRKVIALVALAAVGRAGAFNLPGAIADIFKPPAPTAAGGAGKSSATVDEARLLRAISNTGNGKDADLATQSRVLSLVRRLETSSPPNPALLSDPDEARALDGDWYLQYTAPGEIEGGGGDDPEEDASVADDRWVAVDASEGESNIETRQFGGAGSVSGGGIPVDASNEPALQSFDIANSRVTNEIMTGAGLVTVGGTFGRSPKAPLRAVVAFDTAKIALNVGFTLDISFLFDVRAALKGTKNAGWVETTYLSDDVRIGRGNKGSMFVLTRDRDAVKA